MAIFREDADDMAADHLRRHHESLRNTACPAPGSEPHTESPAPAPVAVPHLLPPDVPDFVGRGDHLTALDAIARELKFAGVIIIDGVAGVGETTLAVHWAHRVTELFPDGVFHADLHGFSDDAARSHGEVVDDFLLALGQPATRTCTSASGSGGCAQRPERTIFVFRAGSYVGLSVLGARMSKAAGQRLEESLRCTQRACSDTCA
ncbi:hypothetical protein [Herbihabitans rhizosphaerae]|uniref:hypothetical protein n=1 Tax=Herbihabitans rhizosphaerae TaxID=1872711 RepID=UPI00102C6182|nr:hypothetical protein [Herbihabitans rhizosphaerae]